MVDFTRYQVPGVYVQDVTTPITTAATLPDSLVALVGTAVGFQTVVRERVKAYSVTPVSLLAHHGVHLNTQTYPHGTAQAPVVTKLNGDPLDDSDYILAEVPATIAGNAPACSLTRLSANGSDVTDQTTPSPHGVADGDDVYVTYSYTDETYFTPQVFEDYQSVAVRYGPPLLSDALLNTNDAQVYSPLTLAAKFAFENGASQVMCVAVNADGSNDRQAYADALTKLENDYRVSIIVPLYGSELTISNTTSPTSQSVVSALQVYISDLQNHCDQSSADGFARIGIVGAHFTYDETFQPFENLADGVNSSRIVLVYPTRFLFFSTSTSQIIECSGYYAAAALAGRLMFNGPARGLTRETPRSFFGIPATINQKMSKSFKDNLSSNGVTVVEQNRSGNLVVRHGLTTDMSSLITREISIIRIGDAVLESLQVGLDNSGLIGDPIDSEMPTRIKGAVTGVLEQLKTNSTILDYAELAVRQESLPSGDPSVVDVKFTYRPAVPLNYITVEFSLDISNGNITSNTTSATGLSTGNATPSS